MRFNNPQHQQPLAADCAQHTERRDGPIPDARVVGGLAEEKPLAAIRSIASATADAWRLDRTRTAARSSMAGGSQPKIKVRARNPLRMTNQEGGGTRCVQCRHRPDRRRGVARNRQDSVGRPDAVAEHAAPRRPHRPVRGGSPSNDRTPGRRTNRGRPRNRPLLGFPPQ
jgi:hypothetical protein